MTQFQFNTLAIFRVFGPCTCREARRRLEGTRWAYHYLMSFQTLVLRGLVAPVSKGRWDVTPAGRLYFALMCRTQRLFEEVEA